MKVKIANRDAGRYAADKVVFVGSNLFAEWRTGTDEGTRYVVFSYGNHWPLYIWDVTTEQWYGNFSRFGVTTSKHFTQARPAGLTSADIIPLHVEDMIKVVDGGVPELI